MFTSRSSHQHDVQFKWHQLHQWWINEKSHSQWIGLELFLKSPSCFRRAMGRWRQGKSRRHAQQQCRCCLQMPGKLLKSAFQVLKKVARTYRLKNVWRYYETSSSFKFIKTMWFNRRNYTHSHTTTNAHKLITSHFISDEWHHVGFF